MLLDLLPLLDDLLAPETPVSTVGAGIGTVGTPSSTSRVRVQLRVRTSAVSHSVTPVTVKLTPWTKVRSSTLAPLTLAGVATGTGAVSRSTVRTRLEQRATAEDPIENMVLIAAALVDQGGSR